MKSLLKIEEAILFLLSLFLFHELHASWWLFISLFLIPDISMFGYLVNAKTGAIMYNIAHHKGIALGVYLTGLYFNISSLEFAGLLFFAHSSFDRILGYGLKYSDSFNH